MPNRVAFCRLSLLTAVIGCCGCSLFRVEEDALTSYEVTRRQIERGDPGVRRVSHEQADPKQQGLSLQDFSISNLRATVDELRGKGPDREIARQLYLEAEADYREAATLQGGQRTSKFLSAAKKYEAAAERWPESALEQDAMYMTGESYFFADRYPAANDRYEKLLKKYPNSRHLDAVEARRFSIAQYWLQLNKQVPQSFLTVNVINKQRPWRDTRGHALRIFDRIRIDDPTGKLADDATMAAANSFFQSGNFLRADEFYTDLRKTFPSSDHQFAAHFLGMQAKLRSYQGADYSGTALDDAEKLIEKMRKQFPVESQKEREHLARAMAEIKFKKAEREWVTARYYDRRTEYGAARIYYQTLLSQYADTPFAEKARRRLEVIQDRPATPPQRLSWLVNVFPEPEEAKPLILSSPTRTARR